MNRPPSMALNVAYCVVVLGAVLPSGLAGSWWIQLALDGTVPRALLAFAAPLLLALLGLYRVFLVARGPSTLSAPQAPGIAAAFRAVGGFLLFVGAFISVFGFAFTFAAGPLLAALLPGRTGFELLAAGAYMALLGTVGVLGLTLFEFGRVLAFERASRLQADPRAGTSP